MVILVKSYESSTTGYLWICENVKNQQIDRNKIKLTQYFRDLEGVSDKIFYSVEFWLKANQVDFRFERDNDILMFLYRRCHPLAALLT